MTAAPEALSVAEVLDRAADLLEARGWGQHEWEGLGGCLCSEGAIARAAGDVPFVEADATPAYEFLVAHLIERGDVSSRFGLVTWNDHPLRTGTQVILAFREAAALARSPQA
jgi:hypothetical protein